MDAPLIRGSCIPLRGAEGCLLQLYLLTVNDEDTLRRLFNAATLEVVNDSRAEVYLGTVDPGVPEKIMALSGVGSSR